MHIEQRASRRIHRRTLVYDHAGALLYFADREKAIELLQNPHVEAGGTCKTIRSFRFSVDVSDSSVNARAGRGTPLGTPYGSVNTGYAFAFIPLHRRREFEQVIREAGAVDRVLPVARKYAILHDAPIVPALPLRGMGLQNPLGGQVPTRSNVVEFPRQDVAFAQQEQIAA